MGYKSNLLLFCLYFILVFNINAQERIVSQGFLNLSSNKNNGIELMKRLKEEGIKGAVFTLHWDRVYPTLDATPNYEQLDNQIDHAMKLGLSFGIRIRIGRDQSKIKGFWAGQGMAMDHKNRPLNHYFTTNASFVNDTANAMIRNFVNEVTKRYLPYHKQNKLMFISVVNAPTQEFEYSLINTSGLPDYSSLFDTSLPARKAFIEYLKWKYRTIRTLNYLCGTNIKTFESIYPFINQNDIKNSFFGRFGEEWYYFRHKMLKDFSGMIQATVHGVDSTIKIVNEHGGVVDNSSALRGTFCFEDLDKGTFAYKPTVFYNFQGDLVYSKALNKKKLMSETIWFDDDIKKIGEKVVTLPLEYNLSNFIMYIDNDLDVNMDNEYLKFLPLIRKAIKIQNEPHKPIVFRDSMVVKTSQLLTVRDEIEDKWRKLSNNGQQHVYINYIEDIVLNAKQIENIIDDNAPANATIPFPTRPKDVPNDLPRTQSPDHVFNVVVNTNFRYSIPNALFFDTDGYIAFIKVKNMPSWVKFVPFENLLFGTSTEIGTFPIELEVVDNEGGTTYFKINLNSVKGKIDFELLKADYFSNGIVSYGFIKNNGFILQGSLPEKTTIRAISNVDSVSINYNLKGPYSVNSTSYFQPHTIFTEGKGITFPEGKYLLTARAIKKKIEYAKDSISFVVYADKIKPLENRIFPNPSSNVFNIKLADLNTTEELKFFIINTNGQHINIENSSISKFEGTINIDLGSNEIKPAVYQLRIEKISGEILYQGKIVKN